MPKKNPQHTPAPWLIGSLSDDVITKSGYPIASRPDVVTDEQWNADKHVIAAAPQLYEALKVLLAEALDWQDALGQGDRPSLDEAIADAQAALKKVLGS
jgi:hypothetical protein